MCLVSAQLKKQKQKQKTSQQNKKKKNPHTYTQKNKTQRKNQVPDKDSRSKLSGEFLKTKTKRFIYLNSMEFYFLLKTE